MAELKKVMSYKTILLIVINSIMGTGIFFLPALGAKIAGPASIIAWALLSILAIYIAGCFAELTSMFPEAGGIYEFSKQAYGRFISFMIGWLSLITANFTIAMLMIGAVRYIFPFDAPLAIIFVSLILIWAFNITAYRGMKVSATLLITFGFVTLFALFSVIIPGLFSMQASNFQPFFPMGLPVIFLAIFFIAETFFGWESPTYLAGEVKDGKKVMPKAIVHGTVIISIISLLFVITAIGSAGWGLFGDSVAPIAFLSNIFYGAGAVNAFAMIVYLAIIGSVAGWVVSAPRLILSMAKDNLFFKNFAEIHPKYSTPYKAIILQMVISSILVIIGAGSYFLLLEILLPMLLVLYIAVVLSVVVLRHRQPKTKRYFTVPFGKVGPVIVSIIFLALMGVWLTTTHGAMDKLQLALSIILLGIPFYLLFEMYYDPKIIVFMRSFFSELTNLTNNMMFPVSKRKKMIKLLGINLNNKKVLDFGCSVGALTTILSKKVGDKGKVYATDESKHSLEIASRKVIRNKITNVTLLQDKINEVNKKVPKVNAIVGVSTLGFVSDDKKVLKQLNKRLKVGDPFCFMEYDKFFSVIPNIEWVGDDKKIKKLFSSAGFSVKVLRKQGVAWQYIYMYGKKKKSI